METWHFKLYRFARRAGSEQSAALCASVPTLKESWKSIFNIWANKFTPFFKKRKKRRVNNSPSLDPTCPHNTPSLCMRIHLGKCTIRAVLLRPIVLAAGTSLRHFHVSSRCTFLLELHRLIERRCRCCYSCVHGTC